MCNNICKIFKLYMSSLLYDDYSGKYYYVILYYIILILFEQYKVIVEY